jgi:hypothetical protein
MPTIPQLSATDTVTNGDLVAVFAQNNGDARKAAMSVLLSYMQDNIAFGVALSVTQYLAPTVSGFTVTLTNSGENAWLVLSPASGFAVGNLVLPQVANAVDQQEIVITSTQAIVTLNIDINGALAIVGEPNSLIAGGFFILRFEGATRTWYRVS